MGKELVTMSANEVERLGTIQRIGERRLSQKKAAEALSLSTRQLRRLVKAYSRLGSAGLVSKRRGQRANNAFPPDLQRRVLDLVRDRYADFGPTLAAEKLLELHELRVSHETLRKWMIAARLWRSRRDRAPVPHQPRPRRDCLGELVQIDGSDHDWFENRGPRCSLLVYVDDATGNLMELRFAATESAFDYFESTKNYLKRHGRPLAFYADKHSIFRVAREGVLGRDKGVTQFGRALGQLSVEIICANTPQAKGRVERMNQTLQDRLVKELRLRGISTMEAGNVFLPTFIDDYNQRFARAPRIPYDAHRKLRTEDDLDRIFTWREVRTMSRDLVVHYKRCTYLIQPTEDTRAFTASKRQVDVIESADGEVEIQYAGRSLPYSVCDQHPLIAQGDIVENKHLGAVLGAIRVMQDARDAARLASPKITVRKKARIAAARMNDERPVASSPPIAAAGGAVAKYFARFAEEQRQKQKAYFVAAKERKRQRNIAAALARHPADSSAP